MLSSPRSPERTMRIFSSAENCRRVTRRICLMTCSAGSFSGPDFCPIFAPSMATMGQKSSLPQLIQSVSQVLMPDTWVSEIMPIRITSMTLCVKEIPYAFNLVDGTELRTDQDFVEAHLFDT